MKIELSEALKGWGFTQLNEKEWEWKHPVLPLIIELDIINGDAHGFKYCLMFMNKQESKENCDIVFYGFHFNEPSELEFLLRRSSDTMDIFTSV